MIQAGAFDAKTHLSSLLDKAMRGEEVLITRRGTLVARLVPAKKSEHDDAHAVVDELRALRAGSTSAPATGASGSSARPASCGGAPHRPIYVTASRS